MNFTTEIASFTGLNGRQVHANTRADRFGVMRWPSKAELTGLIEQALVCRAQESWDLDYSNVFRPFSMDRKVMHGLGTYAKGRTGSAFRAEAVLHKFEERFPNHPLLAIAHEHGCVGNNRWLRQLKFSDQRVLLDALRPKTYADIERCFNKAFFNTRCIWDLKQDLAHHSSSESFLRWCFADFLLEGSAERPLCTEAASSRVIADLLAVLHAQHYILFPIANRRSLVVGGGQRFKPLCSPVFNPPLGQLYSRVLPLFGVGRRKHNSARIKLLLCSTTAVSLSDYSTDLFTHLTKLPYSADEPLSSVGSVIPQFVQEYASIIRLQNQANGVTLHVDLVRRWARTDRTKQRGDPQFRWILQHGERWAKWQQLLSDHLARKRTSRMSGHVKNLIRWLDFLLTLPDPPLSPLEVRRPLHIHNFTDPKVPTFVQYLRGLRNRVSGKPIMAQGCNEALGALKLFFDWYYDELIHDGDERAASYRNPVVPSEDSAIRKADANKRTHRNALGAPFMRLLRQILREDDYAWVRSLGLDYAQAYDSHTGNIVRVWCPAVAVGLETALTIPIRIANLRWMDSGEGDELSVLSAGPSKWKEVRNIAQLGADKRRKQGALRLICDHITGQQFLGLWISTNKTPRNGVLFEGYEVAWLPEQLENSIRMLIDWQRRYNPLAAPVRWDEDVVSKVSPAVFDEVPSFWPLFRNGAAKNPAERSLPITAKSLERLFYRLLWRAQKILKDDYNQDVTLAIEERPGRWTSQLFDLHSLRVSGITAFVEAGVPIPVIAEFISGHASWVNTLRYVSTRPGDVRAVLSKCFVDSDGTLSPEDAAIIRQRFERYEPYMVAGSNADQIEALDYYRRFSSGTELVDFKGICLVGRNCAIGGKRLYGQFSQMVEGGPGCCANCTYWLSGPMFMPGLTHYANTLWLESRAAADGIVRLKNDRIVVENAGRKTRMFSIDAEIAILEARFHAKMLEWFNLLPVVQKAASLLDDYLLERDRLDSTPLISCSVKSDLLSLAKSHLTVECFQTNAFTLLHHINQIAEFHPPAEVRAARFEMKDMLARLLEDDVFQRGLLRLDNDTALRAMNRASEFIVKAVKERDVDDILAGTKRLTDVPGGQRVVRQIARLRDSFDDCASANHVLT